MKRGLLIVGILVGIVPSSGFCDPWCNESKGVDLVVKSTSNRIFSNGRAIVRRILPGGGEAETYKLQFCQSRQDLMITFIHPTPLQGVEIIDDLKTRKTYFPGRANLMSVEESPFADSVSDETRKTLLAKNYRIDLEEPGRKIGRSCTVVKLTPKRSELFSRRLWIDSKTYFMLQQDIWSSSEPLSSSTFFQALSLTVLDEEPDKFEVSDNPDTRLRKDLGGRKVTDPSQIRALVGFGAPKSISPPHGMVETSRRIFKRFSGGYSVYRIQLTDGIVDAWVWMWMTRGEMGREDLRLNDAAVPVFAKDEFGVSAYVQGDAPEAVLRSLAKAYVQGR